MRSALDKWENEILDLYLEKKHGSPEIVKILRIGASPRTVQRWLKARGLIRTKEEALEISTESRIKTIKDKWEGYTPERTRKSINPSLRMRIFRRDKFTCQICGRTPKDGAYIETDHIIAVMDGGTNEESNLQTICNICNSGKYFADHPHTNDLLK